MAVMMGFYRQRHIVYASLKAKMVVLSACQTGRGKITGDGVVGLSRAFIIAGAPSVVVSQWNVDDVMTEYQMGEFYKAFLAGKSKVAALREAQIKTIGFMDRLLAPPPDRWQTGLIHACGQHFS